MIEIPKDPNITSYDKKKAEVASYQRERSQLTAKKEQERQEFLLAQRSDEHALVDATGRDLSRAAFEVSQRRLDEDEVLLLRAIKRGEAELESLKRARAKAVVSANMKKYIDILRRRARALVEVAKLNQQESEFHDEMCRSDVSSGLRPMGVVTVGQWRDVQSLARLHIAELRQHFPELASEDFEHDD